MSKIAIATFAAIAMLAATSAHAQQATRPGAAGAARPAPAAQSNQNAPTNPTAAVQRVPSGSPVPTAPTGIAANQLTITPQDVERLNSVIAQKATACAAKGPLYKWIPPHKPGDVSPRTGRAYTTFSAGSCKMKSGSELLASGLVRTN